MLTLGPAKKVTIYLKKDTSSEHDFLYREIFEFLMARGVSGASLILPDVDSGKHHWINHPPVRIVFIETPERFAALIPELIRLTAHGFIEAHDTTVLKLAPTEAESFE